MLKSRIFRKLNAGRKKSRFSDSQILSILKQAENGVPVPELCRVLGISKRGDSYVRKLLVHGARAILRYADKHDDNLSRWFNALVARKHINVAVVVLANMTARMAWAITSGKTAYDPTLAAG